MARDFDIKAEGLGEFRRDLKRTDAEAAKALQKELKEAVTQAAGEAGILAPYRTGRLARSYRPFSRGNIAGVRSSLPYAGVIEYGGTIYPKRDQFGPVPITIRKYEPVHRAIERQRDQIVRDLAESFEAAARRTGWR